MYVALFSRMQESSIITFRFAKIVPSELVTCVFLRMLQFLTSCFEPVVHNIMQVYPVALLSVNEEYNNDEMAAFESP
jgi:hypothetical protein